MKTSLVILSMFFSLAAVAGPEDQMRETCYTATTSVPSNLPSTFCFENATIDISKNQVLLDGFKSNMPNSMTLDRYIRVNEDQYSFTAKTMILNRYNGGCGDGEFAELVISGNTDFLNEVDVKGFTFKINYSYTNDTCHSHPQDEEITYKLSK
jgi:hypothetical protein